MRESVIERYLVERLRSLGGKAYKWTSPSNVGVPDRICILPHNKIFFVEVKAPTGRLSPVQQQVQLQLSQLQTHTYVTYTKEEIDEVLRIETTETDPNLIAISTKSQRGLTELLA
jgi:hypothetical protein